ncbi:MAG TPA: acyl carrier protein [Arenimonas sp.]|uniref:acyl carrier protein n=1 Tax=Arenimonas sp. TaxID=1872635 RepID=UPI002D80CA57|nr:acyl carrier protein [Arenimonas sp.]HEU0153722.1 acyl carrier protein [Arenimonas sp.]
MTKDQLFQRIVAILHDTFGIDPEKVTPDAKLGEDLDIDSIDAVDLIVQLKPLLGGNLKPEAFRSVRSVQDVVDALHAMMHGSDAPAAGA